jgi:predicted RNase H-like HicB family nuclease
MTPMPQLYRVEIEQEEDGRFLAEVVDLPGVMAYALIEREQLRAAKG